MTQSDIDTLRAEHERLRAALAGLRDAAHRYVCLRTHCGCTCSQCVAVGLRYEAAMFVVDAVLGESK